MSDLLGSLKFSVFSFQCFGSASSLKTEHFKLHTVLALFLKYRTTALLDEIIPAAIFRKTARLSLSVEPRKITRSTHSLRVPSWDSSTGSDTDSVHFVYDRERVPRGDG